ncbi:hypothetical protein GCM10023063_33820 [Arthrobacter methylotrophus]|uniref:PKD domain-containing protein n=1 Tax=Arthrobacter methylotrophus TaxID=121291 RepID=A0ABV5UP95_9MICC
MRLARHGNCQFNVWIFVVVTTLVAGGWSFAVTPSANAVTCPDGKTIVDTALFDSTAALSVKCAAAAGSRVDNPSQDSPGVAVPVVESKDLPDQYEEVRKACLNDRSLGADPLCSVPDSCPKDQSLVQTYMVFSKTGRAVPLDSPRCEPNPQGANNQPFPGVSLADFQKLPIAGATLGIQPSPHTLIGAETNVFAEAATQEIPATVLGTALTVRATPTDYTFNYGDGTVVGPQMFAGGYLPEDRWGEKTRTSHAYQATGDFPVSVTTFYNGEYRIGNGAWTPITGQAQIASPNQIVKVWRSQVKRYADNCIVNPNGDGCPGAV